MESQESLSQPDDRIIPIPSLCTGRHFKHFMLMLLSALCFSLTAGGVWPGCFRGETQAECLAGQSPGCHREGAVRRRPPVYHGSSRGYQADRCQQIAVLQDQDLKVVPVKRTTLDKSNLSQQSLDTCIKLA